MMKEKMPLLFIGHGSPMNAIDDNEYTRALGALGTKLPRPEAILVVSAHWETNGTWVTEMPKPKTIHDFYGFPKALFDVQYPAPGSPEIAKSIREAISQPEIHGDVKWGLDHGTWSVLRHLYPAADIPVLQLSLDITKPPEYHIMLAQQLAKFREKGILILGSGNLVHNLREIRWEKNAKSFDWAIEFDEWFKAKLMKHDFNAVLKEFHQTKAGLLSIPTLEHYYPLHYVLGAADDQDKIEYVYEGMQNGSISMRSLQIG